MISRFFTSNRIHVLSWVLVGTAALAINSMAKAATVVNIDFGPTTSVYSGQGAIPATGDVWNGHAGGFPAPPVNDLVDSTGGATSVGIQFVPGSGSSGAVFPPYLNPNVTSAGLNAPHPLLEDAVRNGADTSPIGGRAFGVTLTGLNPVRPYNLAVYAAYTHSTLGLMLAQVEVVDGWPEPAAFPAPQGSTVPPGLKATTGMGTTGLEEDVNYLTFDNVLSDENGRIYLNVWNVNAGVYALSGLQIEEAPFSLPEPNINDYTLIRAHAFTHQFPGTNGDLTGNGFVDFEDFHLWKSHFPSGAASWEGILIPEPTSAALFGLASLALLVAAGRTARR